MYYENFEKLCKQKNVKPAEVSASTGVSTSTLSAWKKGIYTPKQEKLQLLADFFEVPLSEITKQEVLTEDEMNEALYALNEEALIHDVDSSMDDEDKEFLYKSLMRTAKKSSSENLYLINRLLKKLNAFDRMRRDMMRP